MKAPQDITEKTLAKIEEYNTNGKKTICYFCDVFYPSIDGVISVVNNLSIALKDKFNIVVCVPKHRGKTVWKDDYLVLGARSIKIIGMDYECSFNPANDKKFIGFLKTLHIDIIHIHSPFFMGKFAASYAKKHNIPLFATFHSQFKKDFLNTTHSHLLAKMLLSGIMKAFNKADLVFTMNKFCEKTIRGYGLKVPVKLIGNGTGIDNIIRETDTTAALEIYPKLKDQNILLTVGRLVGVKNFKFSLKAMAKIKTPFTYVIVGEGSLLRPLKKQAKRLGLQDKVVFTGKIMDKTVLAGLYQLADLFVFPSTYDTEGVVVIEAAAKATPSIVIENSGAACKIRNNINGYTEKEDAALFAARIDKILSDKDLNKKIGLNAQKELYTTWETTAEKYIEVYNEAIKK